VINERIFRKSDDIFVVPNPSAGEDDHSGNYSIFLALDVQVLTIPGNSITQDFVVH